MRPSALQAAGIDGAATAIPPPSAVGLDDALAARLADLDTPALRRRFDAQDRFVFVEGFLPPPLQQQLVAAMHAARAELNRNYLPGHKKGGSVSRHAIDRRAPMIAELYRSPAFKRWLEALCGETLQFCPADDPHAYALYFYTEPGDHIGWHYDTSYYRGRRYTVLLGVVDRSSSRLAYQLFTRDASREPVAGELALDPGALVLFDGDRLHHKITPLGTGEERIALTLEYVTDTRMGRWQRLISNWKDAVAYFGLRQVFGRRGGAP